MLNKKHAIIIFVFLFVFFASCEKTNRSEKVDPENQLNYLRFDVPIPLATFNPMLIQSGGCNAIFPLLYSFLCVPDTKGKLRPDLATHWTYDAKTWTWAITLRTDARFHNQHPVTTADVAYTLRQGLKNGFPMLLDAVKKIKIMSNYVLYIQLNHNDPSFINEIWDMAIIPTPGPHRIDYYNAPVGSGPFRFKSRKGQQEIVLTANKDYYNGRPSLDGVIVYYQPDKEKTWTRLLSGATDIAREISPKNYEIMKQYHKLFYFNRSTLNNYSIVLYNTHIPMFSDPTVRRALSLAIDRWGIVNKILHGFGKVAVGPMGVDTSFHNPSLFPVPYDPQQALALLHQAGWRLNPTDHYLYKNNRCFAFTLLVFAEYQIEKRIAQYIRLCLNDIGIKMHIRLLPYDQLVARYSGNDDFQAVLTEFSGAGHRPQFLADLWCPGPNRLSFAGGFDNPQVTKLFGSLMKESDSVRRMQDFYQIDSLIASLQPGTFLYQRTAINVMSRRFVLPFPFTLTYGGVYRLQFASLRR